MKAMSLFACGGMSETYLHEVGIETVIANELLEDRADFYRYRFPSVNMIQGDIKEKKETLIELGKEAGIDLLMATPPCQGMSTLGKRDYDGDERNYLIFDVFDIIDALNPKYVFIENVPKFLNMYYPYKGNVLKLMEVFEDKYGDRYEIKYGVYNAADYGVPQRRKRAIIRMWHKGLEWGEPEKCEKHITLREAIGHLPSLENEEDSGIKWHYTHKIADRYVEMLRHTPTGKSAFENEIYYPKRMSDGKRISGYADTYRRLDWDSVCPTRTMRSADVGGSSNCHPGRLIKDGDESEREYSDARVLTILELLIVSSLPTDIDFPSNVSDTKIRALIGEGVPPRMTEAFMKAIKRG